MRSLVIAIAASLAACSQSGEAGRPAAVDGGPETPPPLTGPDVVTVTTHATSATGESGAKASATWAAYVDGAGAWHTLAPASEGTYAFHAPDRWSVVLVCSADGDHTIVYAFRRTLATTALDVTLSSFCTPLPPPEDGAIRGTLTNLPSTTTWLDFGYARDWRGTALPVSGTSASYEIVNVAEGPWDIAFAVRDDSALPFTRMVVRRGEVLAVDKTIDVDVTGPGSFVPGKKNLTLHAIADGDSTNLAIYYGMGGPFGVDVGPQDVPPGADTTATYSTIPPEVTAPGDRYRASLVVSENPDRPEQLRAIVASFHDPIDIDATFLPIAELPAVTLDATAPYARTTTHAKPFPGAVRYEILAAGEESRRTTHEWRTSIDVASLEGAPEIVDAIPDLSSLPGWDPSWAIHASSIKIDVTAFEAPQPLGDGTIERSSMRSIVVP
jgi:hypothetical protein